MLLCAQDFPDRHILEPWKAPASVQQQAGCVIGKDCEIPF